MKKLVMLLMTVVLAMSLLVGCGGSDDNTDDGKPNTDNDNVSQESYEGHTFTLNGTKIELNAEMAPIVTALGEADSYFESESCAFQGLDKVYTYGSVIITTYPENEVDYVYTIELKDDTVETEEGVYIGADVAAVEDAYGEPTEKTDAAYVYKMKDSQLNIMLQDGVVSSIVYMAITE